MPIAILTQLSVNRCPHGDCRSSSQCSSALMAGGGSILDDIVPSAQIKIPELMEEGQVDVEQIHFN